MVDDGDLRSRSILVAGFDAETLEEMGDRLGLDMAAPGRQVRLAETVLSRLQPAGDDLVIGIDWPEIAVARALNEGRDADAALAAWLREARIAAQHVDGGCARLFEARAASPDLLEALLHERCDLPIADPASEAALIYAPAAAAWVRGEPEAQALADALAEAAGIARFAPEALSKQALADASAIGRGGAEDRAQARIEILELALSACRSDLDLLAAAGGRRARRSLRDRPAVRRARAAWRSVMARMRRKADLALIRDSDLFDADWYCDRYPDVDPAHTDPALHYLLHGGGEGRPAGPNFDATGYMILNPDLRALDLNPLVHYLRRGRLEGRPALTLRGEPVRARRSA